MKITFTPIGIIHSPFIKLEDMPIQPAGAQGITGSIELYPQYIPALQDLDGFSHIYVLYHFHKSRGWKPMVTPFLDKQERGLFSTRAPHRPNPIGLSVLKIDAIVGNRIQVSNVDILDGTPLLDIKPYVPQFDGADDIRIGWVRENIRQVKKSKDRSPFFKMNKFMMANLITIIVYNLH
jgi:tRNA-Thr(GGU) m(6)t(6)A37 methyltransferase TsaA